VKKPLLRLLARGRVLTPAYRTYERVRAVRPRRSAEPAAAGGLPVPPAHLIVRVAGRGDTAWFLESGRLAAESINAAVARAGMPIEAVESILDFGCGCGRVVRQWTGLDARLAGSDLSAEAIDWCRANLPFARFEVNGLSPPVAFEPESFELAYALSVLTHLPEAEQHAWLDELARVVRPDGLLLLTTHGERYLERLDEDERRRFRSGELVVRWAEAPGTNLCTTFHPPSWLREHLPPHGFEELEFVPEGAAGNPHQDLLVLRRTS
jgi:SAM-dependent methyltransferase